VNCARAFPYSIVYFVLTNPKTAGKLCVPFKGVSAVAFNKGSSATRFEVVNVCRLRAVICG